MSASHRRRLAALALWLPAMTQAQITLSQLDQPILQSVPVSHLQVAELNEDDRMDLIALRAPSGAPQDGAPAVVVQRRLTNNGPFEVTQVLPTQIPVDLRVTDLDNDGDQDLLVVEEGPGSAIRIWVNQGGWQPGPAGLLRPSSHTYPYDLAVGLCLLRNLQTGLRQDMLLTRSVGRDAIWLQALGTIPGLMPVHVEGQRLPHPGADGALCADFDGDGLDDVLIYGSQTQLWLRRTDAATPFVLSSGGTLLPGQFVSAAAARDLDGDGDLDLLLGSFADDHVLEHQGPSADGSPVYVEVGRLDGVGSTQGYLWLDVDGDGDEDLLALRDNHRAGPAIRGTAVFLRQGLAIDASAVQLLAPAAAGAIAPLQVGTAPRVWLGGSQPGNNGLWGTGLPPPPPTVRLTANGFGPSQAYFMAGSVGAYLDILPQAGQPFSVDLLAEPLFGGLPAVSWRAPVASGQAQTLSIETAATGDELTWRVSLQGIHPPGAATIGSPATTQISIFHNPFASLFTLRCYIACVGLGFCDDSRSAGLPAAAGGSAYMATEAEVTLLRRLRDERMAGSIGGQYYIGLYEDLSLDLYGATFVDPRFYLELWALKDAWMPAVANLVDGDGQMPVSTEMAERLRAILLRFQLDGSAELRQAIEVERQALGLNQLAGRPISWLQQRWEATPLLIDDFEGLGEAASATASMPAGSE